jgi:hypothetical protein
MTVPRMQKFQFVLYGLKPAFAPTIALAFNYSWQWPPFGARPPFAGGPASCVLLYRLPQYLSSLAQSHWGVVSLRDWIYKSNTA